LQLREHKKGGGFSLSLAQGADPSRTLLLVLFSALLVSSLAAKASARPSLRWTRRQLLEDSAKARPRTLQAEDPAVLGSYGATRLDSPHPGLLFTNWCSLPPAIPPPPRASRALFRTNTALLYFHTLGVAPLILLASACGVVAASKRPLLLYAPPLFYRRTSFPFGGRKKKEVGLDP
jgi:hypothetical protein